MIEREEMATRSGIPREIHLSSRISDEAFRANIAFRRGSLTAFAGSKFKNHAKRASLGDCAGFICSYFA
jgi:hypothetical protein